MSTHLFFFSSSGDLISFGGDQFYGGTGGETVREAIGAALRSRSEQISGPVPSPATRAVSFGLGVITSLLAQECSGGKSLIHYFGGGYELATFSGGRFTKVEKIAYLLQEFDGSVITPKQVLLPRYEHEILFFHSANLTNYEQINVIGPPHIKLQQQFEEVKELLDFPIDCFCVVTNVRTATEQFRTTRIDWNGAIRLTRKSEGGIAVETASSVVQDLQNEIRCRSIERARAETMGAIVSRGATPGAVGETKEGGTREIASPSERSLLHRYNLANRLYSQKKYAKAATCFEEVLAAIDKQAEPNLELALACKSALASLAGAQGDYEGAVKMLRNVLTEKAAAFGKTHWQTLVTQANLAHFLANSGRLEEAKTLQTKVVDARRAALRDGHVDTAHAKASLAAILFSLKDIEAAIRVQREVVANLAVICAPQSPLLIEAYNRLRLYMA